METPSPFPEGFSHAGLCRPQQQGAGDPPGTALPGTAVASADEISRPAAASAKLALHT